MQREPAAEDAGLARKETVPGCVADHGDGRCPRHVVVNAQRAPQHGLGAEHAEEVARDGPDVEQERAGPVSCCLWPRVGAEGASHLLERPGFPAEAPEVFGGERQVPDAPLSGAPEHDDAILVADRQRLPQDRVADREHRHGEADAKRQHPDRGGAEGGRADQRPTREAQILGQIIEPLHRWYPGVRPEPPTQTSF